MADTTYAAAPALDLLGTRAPEHHHELLRYMRECFQSAVDYEGDNRRQQVEWLEFRAGKQWRPEEEQSRIAAGRPCLTVNTLPQSEHQITNEVAQNMPALTVLPVGNGADVDTAKLLKGVVRHCNLRSHAEEVRMLALESAVRIGAGYYRMALEYDDWNSFDQEPRIAGLRNQFACYLDPSATSSVGRDARWGFIFEDQDREAFRQEWGIDAATMNAWQAVGNSWIKPRHVRVAEYFFKDARRMTLAQVDTGETVLLEPYLLQELPLLEQSGYSDGAFQNFVAHLLTPRPRWTPLLDWIRQQAPTVTHWLDGFPQEFVQGYALKVMDLVASLRRVRPTQYELVRWIKTNGHEILEESVWPGKHIPLLRVVGEEIDLDNRVHRSGIIANAMDPMRLENYFLTMQAEHVALAPVPPWILDERQIDGAESYWRTANRQPYPYLPYKAIVQNGVVVPPPQRQQYEPPVQAIALTLQMVQQYTQQALGIYQGNVGAPSKERSGKAIEEKDRQADTGSYHYPAHLRHTVHYEGEQYLDLIPKTLWPGKIQRIVGDDGTASMIRLAAGSEQRQQMMQDPALMDGMAGVYDLTSGTYDVVVDIGPSYATKRQEAAEQMLNLVGTLPEAMQPVISQVVEKMDWEGARELADLLKQLPGQILPQGGNNKDQQLALLRQKLTQLGQELQALDAFGQQQQALNAQLVQENQTLKQAHDLKALEVQDTQQDTRLAEWEAQQKWAIEERKLALEERKVELEAQRLEIERQYKAAAAQGKLADASDTE